MSWARDEWKEGLTAQALRKVSEFEENVERGRKEVQQRQFQLDSMNAALHKQKILTEEQKNVGNEYKRELQLVSERCDEYEKAREKIAADIHTKELRIKCLDGLLLKEKQALEREVSKSSRFKDDLVANIAKYDKLLSEHNKLQRDVQLQVRQGETSHHEIASRAFSCPSSSDSEAEKEVFLAKTPKETTPCKIVQQEPQIFSVRTRSHSSASSSDGMCSSFETPNFQTPSEKGKIKELQKTVDCIKKEKGVVTDKWQKSVEKVEVLQSQLTAMENKQKQLVQEIECSRHNAEAGRKHQEERMKEKEREYRGEISTQTKVLVQLEQELKDRKIKLEQEQKSADVRVKEFEVTTKKLQKEMATARNAVEALEVERNEQRGLVESCKNTIAELRREMRTARDAQAVAGKSHKENGKTIEDLSHQLKAANLELEMKKQMVAELENSRESLVAEERAKYLEVLRTRAGESNDAGARVYELEKFLETSNNSHSEMGDVLRKQIEELTLQVAKTAPLLKEKQEEIANLKTSLKEKSKDVENMAGLLEKCTNPEELKRISEEKLQAENNLESTRGLCESLKNQLKEREMEVSQVDTQRQVLQMDSEDKDELIMALEQQKATLEDCFQENAQKISQLKEDLRVANEEMGSLRCENELLRNGARELESTEKQRKEEGSQIRITLENAIATKASLAEELSKTTDEKSKLCEMYEIRIGELERMLNELKYARDIAEKNALTQLNEKLTEAERNLNEKTRELDGITPRYKSLQEDFNETVVKLEKAAANLDCMKTRATALASQKSNLLADLKMTEQQRDDKIKMLAELEASISEKDGLIAALGRSNEKIIEKRNAEFESAESKIKELSYEHQDKTRLLTQESEKVDELFTERDRLEGSVDRLRAELQEKERERQKFADQCQDLERSCAEYKFAVERLDGELFVALEEAEKQRASFEEKYSKLREELVLTKDNTEDSNNTIEEMKNNFESLKSAKHILSEENDRLKSDNLVALQEAEKVGARCEELSERSARQEELLNEYNFTVEQLGIELSSTKELYESTEIRLCEDSAKLRDELRIEKENVDVVRNDLGEKLFCISSLTVEKECLQIELENAKAEMECVAEKLRIASAEDNQDEEMEILREKLEIQEASLQEYRRLKDDYEDVQCAYAKAVASLEKSKETRASLEDSLKNSASEKTTLFHELKQNVDTYEALVRSINEEKSALEKAVARYKSSAEEVQDQLDSQIRRAESTEYLMKQKDEELFVTGKELDSKVSDVQRLEKAREASGKLELELRHHLGVVTQELEVFKEGRDESEELVKAEDKINELEEEIAAKSSKFEEEREDIVTKTKEFALQLEKHYAEKTELLEGELRKKEHMLSSVSEENCQLSHQLEVELKSKKILLNEIEERENEFDLKKGTTEKALLTSGRIKELEMDLEEERKLTKRLQEKWMHLDELMLKELKNRVELQKKVKRLQDEVQNVEEKDEKIGSLESNLKNLSQQLDSVKSELESGNARNVSSKKEVAQLKRVKLELEKRLQDETIKCEMLRIEYEQLKQNVSDFEVRESEVMVAANEQADSMKVCELECCIDSLKKEMADQIEKIALGENSLKHALDSKDTLERSLNEELKQKEELLGKVRNEVSKVQAREEKISVLETQVEMATQQFASVKAELEAEMVNRVAFGNEVEELKEKVVNLVNRLREEAAKVCELQGSIDALKKELAEQQEKVAHGENSLQEALERKASLVRGLNEKLKQRDEFLEEKEAEVFEVEEKCSVLGQRCVDYEKKLGEEGHKWKAVEKRMTNLSKWYNDAKKKLVETEEEKKPMMERLIQLEGEMVMMPRIEDLQMELERLKKELKDEKENAVKYEKLSWEYSKKLDEFTSANNRMPTNAFALATKDKEVDEKVTLIATPQPLKNDYNHIQLTVFLPEDDQKIEDVQVVQSSETTPVIWQEQQLILSPVTRSLSKLGFSTPVAEKPSDTKKPSGLFKRPVTKTIPKSIIKPPSNLPDDRKRKDVKDKIQPNAKRMKCDATSELSGIRSPFILNRNRGIQTRSKTSTQPSRLPQSTSRIPQSKSRPRIPKRTVTAAERNPTAAKGSLNLPPSIERSSEECKMQ